MVNSSLTSVGTLGSLTVTGSATFAGINTATSTTLFARQLNVSGISTLGALNLTAGNTYQIAGVNVLSNNTLGANIVNSSLTSVGTLSGGLNIASGQTYRVNGTAVLDATTLGSGVVNSSLTSVGTLGSLNVTNAATAGSFVRSGGTSAQFLKADGTVDSNSYITSASVGNGTLTLNVSGTGLTGSQTFTANQSGNATFTVTSNATSANTVSTIVARDASGNFSAGTITAALSGNASTATTLQTARNINGTSFNGSADITITANTPNTLTLNTSGTGLSGSTTFNGGSAATFTVASNATSANTVSTIVARDASGNFSAGTITAALSGNATSATTASTASQLSYASSSSPSTRYLVFTDTLGGNSGANVNSGVQVLPSTGAITASSFVRSGGTSSQFLKADGTVDSNTYITSASVGDGTLTLNVSGTGLSGSQTFTANQSGNATFTVTSNATSANNINTIVARDGSGNFSAGTITASSFVRSGGTSAQFLKADGSVDTNTYLTSSQISVTDDTVTNATRYLTFTSSTSGSISGANVSSTKLQFNPLSGNLAATQFTSLSDATQKTNIRPIENPIEITKQLDGVRFDWINNNKPSLGLIAQEVEKVLPELVETNSDGIKSVSYSNMVGLLIEAIKEQQIRIEELERKLNV